MKIFSFILLTSLFISSVFLQGLDEDCTTSGVNSTSEYDFVDPGNADHILYAIICQSGSCYLPDMQSGGSHLVSILANEYLGTGSTIDLSVLYSDGLKTYAGASFTPTWSKYTQVWVADLSSASDSTGPMNLFYQAVAAWYNSRGQPHIICDGRYISSLWPNGVAKNLYTEVPKNRPERKFILNYFAGLRVRGGGLALLTDHDVFNSGINTINAGIGIGGFNGFFHEDPYLMEVDVGSTLFTYPVRSYYLRSELGDSGNRVATYWPGRNYSELGIFIDDSSTSFTPYNLQPNGKVLYPVGWHKGQLNKPGLSTTIRGQVGFLIEIITPLCKQRYEAGNNEIINFQVKTIRGGTNPIKFTWISSLDGTILNNVDSASANFTRNSNTLSVGTHVITVIATDAQNLKSVAKVRIIIVYSSGNSVCYSGAWNHGSDVYEIYPIRRQQSAVEYFKLGNPIPESSNTPDKLEVKRVGQYFFYENPEAIYLISIYGSGSDPAGVGKSKTNFTVDFYNNVDFLLRNPNMASNYFYNPSLSYGVALHNFGSQTSGYIFGPFPKGQKFCVNVFFDRSNQDNLDQIYMRSHSSPSNDTVSSSPIVFFPNPILLTSSLRLCYSQCQCTDSTYTSLTGSFDNHAVTFGLTGNIGNYRPNSNCVFDIVPDTVDPVWGISVYFHDFQFGSGDQIEIFEDANSTGIFTGNSISNLHSDAETVKIVFTSDNDGVVGRGFDLTYWVLPGLVSISPFRVPEQQDTLVTVTGFNFINSSNLKCQIDGRLTIAATFVDSRTITCLVPKRDSPFSLNVDYNFEVSNDGIRYTVTDGSISGRNNVSILYYDASCSDITDCSACTSKGTCEWCNDLTNSSNSACYPRGASSCPSPNLDIDCCTKCQPFLGCSGNGQCNCNNTCTCDSDYFPAELYPTCSCKKCPVHPNGEYCGKVDEIGRVIGTCNCNGTCECAAGFWGPDCSCVVCDGYNGKTCGGHGTCGCDGNCTCDNGYVSLTETFQKCECSNICPSNCSGHGTCNCGVCQCDVGYNLLPDCSCVERCESDCNRNGICNCDGTCTCYDGFNGTFCETRQSCENLTCEACQNLTYCHFCPIGTNGSNIGSCFHQSNRRNSICSLNDFLKKKDSCLSFSIQEAPAIVNTPAFIALGVGLAILLALAIVLAVLLKRSKSKADILLNGEDPFSSGATGINPLHESDTKTFQNKIFQTGNDDL